MATVEAQNFTTDTDEAQEQGAWSGQSKDFALGYRVFIWLLKNLGVSAGYVLLIFVAFWYFLFDRKAIKASMFYYREIHNQSWWQARKNTYISFYRIGQVLLDKVALLSNFTKRFTFSFDGEHLLRQMAAENRGGILLSAHVGNWEIAGQLLQRLDVPVNIVMFDNEYQSIKQLLNSVMEERSFKTIVIKDDFSHLIAMHKAIKNKEFICIHGDRFIERNKDKTEIINFMGEDARFPRGPFELTARFKIPYIFVYGFKETNKHYSFYAFRGPENTGNHLDIIKEYTKNLEKMVYRYPKQWFNFYEFWERQQKE